MNLEGELLSRSQGRTQKSLRVAQQRGRKVRFGSAAASSCHVLSLTGQWPRSGVRGRLQHDCVHGSGTVGEARVMLSSECFVPRVTLPAVLGIQWLTTSLARVSGRNVPFPCNLASELSILGAIQLDKPRLRRY